MTDAEFITDMLYDKDIAAYVAEDWEAVADDFDADAFVGWVQRGSGPMEIAFGNLDAYRDDWLSGAATLLKGTTPARLAAELRAASRIDDIQFRGKWALVRKVFDGRVGADETKLDWTTYYHCRKDADRWRIVGFSAFFPAPSAADIVRKRVPDDARQHATAGPYSPVLIIPAGDLVAIAGQGPLNEHGQVVGETIEEQTAKTLENCRRQLAFAGCTLDDVFKVTVHLADLDEWGRFNEVYSSFLSEPYPVRTTTGTALLLGMRVEIDMLARRPSSE